MDKVEKLALKLQSQGPDEFPWGYYLWLAKQKIEERDKEKKV